MASNIENTNSYLSFKIGEELFASNVNSVLNILELTKITRVPKSPAYMKGVINLRGSVIPIMDTRIKLGLPETENTSNTCILILEVFTHKESMKIGAIVDSVQEVIEITNSEILPAPSIGKSYSSDLLNGIIKINDQFIMLINIDKVFGVEEVFDISELTSTVN